MPDTSWARAPPTSNPPAPIPSLVFFFSLFWFIYEHDWGRGSYSIYYTRCVFPMQNLYWTVPLGCQIVLRLKSFDAHIRGGFHAKSYNRSRAYDAIPWYFLKANTPPTPHSPPPRSLRFTPLPSLIHCSYWRQDMLASMRPALTELFFHLDHNGIIRLREIPCLRGFLDWFDKYPTSFVALRIIPYNWKKETTRN